ncbi:hypothetical protein EXIGLDRAFT_779124 [Exidia glandulosa HHB12029]|uniref:Uncharacterized protein n=1 Tax=Exidia glandulosa HHB12029 TaxID=1314781 RepID=A0A165C7U1_EXIGL|nr:hypothetical protein EXIGLDRAFT_779124 [Exidia glandulosa HHB12029]
MDRTRQLCDPTPAKAKAVHRRPSPRAPVALKAASQQHLSALPHFHFLYQPWETYVHGFAAAYYSYRRFQLSYPLPPMPLAVNWVQMAPTRGLHASSHAGRPLVARNPFCAEASDDRATTEDDNTTGWRTLELC